MPSHPPFLSGHRARRCHRRERATGGPGASPSTGTAHEPATPLRRPSLLPRLPTRPHRARASHGSQLGILLPAPCSSPRASIGSGSRALRARVAPPCRVRFLSLTFVPSLPPFLIPCRVAAGPGVYTSIRKIERKLALLFPKECDVDGGSPGGVTGGGQADQRQEARRSTPSPSAGASMEGELRRRYPAILCALVVPDSLLAPQRKRTPRRGL